MTKEEYIQKAVAEAKSTSGSTYALLALMEEIADMKRQVLAALSDINEAFVDLREVILTAPGREKGGFGR